MNQSRSQIESDFFGQEQPVVGPTTSQWQRVVDRLRGVDKKDPLRLPRSRASKEVCRRMGRNILQTLDLELNPRPPDQETPIPRERRYPNPRQRRIVGRRIGAAALALGLGIGAAAWAAPKLIESLGEDAYDVSDRTPKKEEVCTITQTNGRALLLVASEFTNDMSSRRAAASRIGQATRNQDDDRFGICYDPGQNYSRVLTDEAVEGLPASRLVDWDGFPGRTDRIKP